MNCPTYSYFFCCLFNRGSHFAEMLEFMASLKNGDVNGVKVRVGRLQVNIVFFFMFEVRNGPSHLQTYQGR